MSDIVLTSQQVYEHVYQTVDVAGSAETKATATAKVGELETPKCPYSDTVFVPTLMLTKKKVHSSIATVHVL